MKLLLPVFSLCLHVHSSEIWTLEQEVLFDEVWRNLYASNYTDGLWQFPENFVKPLNLEGYDRNINDHAAELCPKGYFNMNGADSYVKCQKYLNCNQISNSVKVDEKVLVWGLGKQLRTGYWYNNPSNPNEHQKVAYLETRPERINTPRISDRVKLGTKHLLDLQPSQHVNKVIGYCYEDNTNKTVVVAEFCDKGDLRTFLHTPEFAPWSTLKRFQFATQLVEAFDYLHNSPIGTRINCDMNRLHRAMSQFLVTHDYRIVLNDLDDIPLVTPESRCAWVGRIDTTERRERGENPQGFLAPEQRLSEEILAKGKSSQVYSDPDYVLENNIFPPQTEKVDIFKIPDMVMHIVFKNASPVSVRRQIARALVTLKPILTRCKSWHPEDRPSTTEILFESRKVLAAIEDLGW